MGESGDEENPRGVATGEGEVVDRNGDVHGGIVVRAGAADEDLEEANGGEVEDEAEEEGDQESSEVWGRWGQEERE